MSEHRVILVGCGKAKLDHAAQARDLYTGNLFRARRAYAEAATQPWYIVSAKHGLVAPDTLVYPYDRVLRPATVSDLAFKVRRTAASLLPWGPVAVEVHAGALYVDAIERWARMLDGLRGAVAVEAPLAGLGIGEQLAWYRTNTPAAAA